MRERERSRGVLSPTKTLKEAIEKRRAGSSSSVTELKTPEATVPRLERWGWGSQSRQGKGLTMTTGSLAKIKI